MSPLMFAVVATIVVVTGVVKLIDCASTKARGVDYLPPVSFMLIGLAIFFLGHGK